MKIFAQKISFNTHEEKWEVEFSTDFNIKKVQACYHYTTDYLHPDHFLSLDFTQTKEHTYTISFLNSLLAYNGLKDNQTNWKFRCFTEEESCLIEADGPIHYSAQPLKTSPFDCYFDFPVGELTFITKPKPLTAILTEYNLADNRIAGQVTVDSEMALNAFTAYIAFKRRPDSALYLFHDEQQYFQAEIIDNNQIKFSIPISELDDQFLVDEKNIIDLFLVFRDDNEDITSSFININETNSGEISKQIIDPSHHRIISSYVTGSKRLSFVFKQDYKKSIYLLHYKESPEKINFTFDFTDKLNTPKLVLKKQMHKGRFYDYAEIANWVVTSNLLGKNTVSIDKNDLLFADTHNVEATYLFFLRSENKPDLFISTTQLETKSTQTITEFNDIKLIKTKDNCLALQTVTKSQTNKNAPTIFIFGSCLSTDIFNTDPYFNPESGKLFHLVGTHMYSSILSLMTKPIACDKFEYAALTSEQKAIVQADFSKTFFAQLREKKPDFLLIDLFADAARPSLWLTDESAITLSTIIEESSLLNQIPFKKISDHENNKRYFNEWKEYADLFIEQLRQCMPEQHIILNKTSLATKYFDKNKKISNHKQKMLLERINLFWQQLNNYVQAQLPNARVIDMDEEAFIGSNYSQKQIAPLHYQSKYYKEALKELAYILATTN